MNKTILTIISTAFISTIFLQASSKVEIITNDSSSITINDNKSKVTIKKCQEYLGLENYNFINKIYSDKNVALLKCEKELSNK